MSCGHKPSQLPLQVCLEPQLHSCSVCVGRRQPVGWDHVRRWQSLRRREPVERQRQQFQRRQPRQRPQSANKGQADAEGEAQGQGQAEAQARQAEARPEDAETRLTRLGDLHRSSRPVWHVMRVVSLQPISTGASAGCNMGRRISCGCSIISASASGSLASSSIQPQVKTDLLVALYTANGASCFTQHQTVSTGAPVT